MMKWWDKMTMLDGVEREDPIREPNVQKEEVRNYKDDFCLFYNNSGTGLIKILCF